MKKKKPFKLTIKMLKDKGACGSGMVELNKHFKKCPSKVSIIVKKALGMERYKKDPCASCDAARVAWLFREFLLPVDNKEFLLKCNKISWVNGEKTREGFRKADKWALKKLIESGR